jgi:hypothetical protein
MTIECVFIGVLGRDAEVKNSLRGKPHLKLNLRVAEGDDAQWVSVLSFDAECNSSGWRVRGRARRSMWRAAFQ